jgi:hypothetical protein
MRTLCAASQQAAPAQIVMYVLLDISSVSDLPHMNLTLMCVRPNVIDGGTANPSPAAHIRNASTVCSFGAALLRQGWSDLLWWSPGPKLA